MPWYLRQRRMPSLPSLLQPPPTTTTCQLWLAFECWQPRYIAFVNKRKGCIMAHFQKTQGAFSDFLYTTYVSCSHIYDFTHVAVDIIDIPIKAFFKNMIMTFFLFKTFSLILTILTLRMCIICWYVSLMLGSACHSNKHGCIFLRLIDFY